MTFVPLPYFTLASGAVPVVRFAFLTVVVGVYGASLGTSTIGWTIVALLAAHTLVYAAMLALGARLVVRALPTPTPTLSLLLALGALALGCSLFPMYHTPFDDASAYTTWWGLLQ